MSILDTIVESKRIQFPKTECISLEQHFEGYSDPTNNPFVRSLLRPGVSIIGEIKPSSPSAGKLLVDNARLPEILEIYKNQCAAVSVLTDEKFFSGSFELLSQVKQATGLPVLCKDFIISKEQILLAKNHGADAILLIAKILEREELTSLLQIALNLGLCPVVEINNLRDLGTIAGLPIQVVLINNRNLDTMQIDLTTTDRLAHYLNENQIIISASGIKTKADIEQLLPSARRFLIGTSLMSSPDPETFIKELTTCKSVQLGDAAVPAGVVDAARMAALSESQSATLPGDSQPAARSRIKICGITNGADATMSVDAGADFIGMIFAPSSKRQVTLEEARTITLAINNRAKVVGVFQDQTIEEVNQIAEELNLDFIQLHGQENRSFMNACSRPVIKVFQYPFAKSANHQQLLEFAGAQYFLFDLSKDSTVEENIERFSELNSFLSPIRNKIPPFFLAGKLSPGNVQTAYQAVLPFGVDAASGVEISAGAKSTALTKQFCNLANSKSQTHAPQVVNK